MMMLTVLGQKLLSCSLVFLCFPLRGLLAEEVGEDLILLIACVTIFQWNCAHNSTKSRDCSLDWTIAFCSQVCGRAELLLLPALWHGVACLLSARL